MFGSTDTFWGGHEFDHWHREYEKRRASLQQRGSRHAHENRQAVGRKATGRFKLLPHRIANGRIDEAVENGCTIVAVEELTGIRDRLSGASWGHKWAFERLDEYVAYEAELHGISVAPKLGTAEAHGLHVAGRSLTEPATKRTAKP